VLDDRELSLVWRASENIGVPHNNIVKLLILTGARKSEVSDLPWQEIADLNQAGRAVWNLPALRAKNKHPLTVPLAPGAVAILRAMPQFARRSGETDYVFGVKAPSGFSNAKKALDCEIMRLNNGKPIEGWVFHDLRRSFVTGLARLGVELHVIERIVNHVSGTFGGIVSVYQKHKFESEMREALNKWADHIDLIVSTDVASASKIAEPA
jgi:integrase